MALALEFFDPTKEIGHTSNRRAQFVTATDLLRYMDRLGIARSLVYHSEARAYHPLLGNRLLLDELDGTPGTAHRLVPAAVVAPALRYIRSGLDELQASVSSWQVRALRYFGGNWGLRQIEPIIAALSPHRPLLIFDAQQPPTFQEIADFAVQFPDLPLLYLQSMWPGELQLADLMERCPNLHIDTSWMHTDEIIEFMVRNFGAERVLFGAGPDSHNGAAIAALVHAELNDKERALIAHGNLERLLGLPEFGATGITPFSHPDPEKPLWNAYLRGESLSVDIVDAHAHSGVAGGTWLREETDPDAVAFRLLNQMDRIGIDTVCLAPMRALAGDAVTDLRESEDRYLRHPGRFYGYVVFNPFQANALLGGLDDFFARDFYIGFKLLCSYWKVPLTDARFIPMWEYADAHSMPILMHTWIDSYNNPSMLSDIAPAYPNAIFILGHSGGSDHKTAIDLARDNPNVYLEWCGSFCSQQRWEEVIPQVGTDRILFGSDTILHDLDWELGRMLSLDMTDAEIAPMLGANMRDILSRRR